MCKHAEQPQRTLSTVDMSNKQESTQKVAHLVREHVEDDVFCSLRDIRTESLCEIVSLMLITANCAYFNVFGEVSVHGQGHCEG